MSKLRVIPCLDTANGRLVKGVRFANVREMGDPVEAACNYAQQGADEICVLDILASKQGQEPNYEILSAIHKSCAAPLIFGGGVSSLDIAEKVVAAGASRVGIGSAALDNPELVRRVSYKFGPAATVALVDVEEVDGEYIVLGAGQKRTERRLLPWLLQLKDLGAGEILLTTMQDGQKKGYDLPSLRLAASSGLPVIASGGAGKLEHFLEAAQNGASAVLAASLFHEGTLTVAQVKEYLRQRGVEVAAAGLDLSMIRFDERGLVPAIAQDVYTGAVLMLAYMNEESLRLTLETGYATYYSRSRQALWKKGETSGHTQKLRELLYDCDGDTLLLKVEQTGPACHTGEPTCFYRSLKALPGERNSGEGASILQRVYGLILDRKAHPKAGSYTNSLLEKGVDKIGKKLVEEAAETLIAAKNGSRDELAFESADLAYHLLVLLANAGLSLDDLYAELSARHRP